MSRMLNLGPLITKIARDLLDRQDTVLDVETVYARLYELHGDAVFESAQQLAEIAIKQKIKAHLRSAHSVGGEVDTVPTLFEGAPAAVAVKQKGGGYAYVPLRVAGVAEINAATKAKERNIELATAAFKRWNKFVTPILATMKRRRVNFGEAQKIEAKKRKAA